MPPATPALALMALVNATTPERPLWNVTPDTPTDHFPRERTSYARPHISLHTLTSCTLLRGTTDNTKHPLHCTQETRTRSGLWPIAPLSSSLGREGPRGPAFMMQTLLQQYPGCSLDTDRQQSRRRQCQVAEWGPQWPSDSLGCRAQPSRNFSVSLRVYRAARQSISPMHSSCIFDTDRQQCLCRHCREPDWGPQWPSDPDH